MLSIYQELTAADRADAQARGALATAHLGIGRVLAKTGQSARALESYRNALALAEDLYAADPTSMALRFTVAISRAGVGEVYTMLASRPETPAEKRIEHCREAHSWLQQSLEILNALKAHDALHSPDLDTIDRIATAVATCADAIPGSPAR